MIALAFFIFLSLFTSDQTKDLKLLKDKLFSDEFTTVFSQKVKNQGGLFGVLISSFLFYTLGYSAFLLPIFMVLWGANRLFKMEIRGTSKKLLFFFLFIILLGLLFSISYASKSKAYTFSSVSIGGWVAFVLAGVFLKLFGVFGSYVIGIAALLGLAIFTTPLTLSGLLLVFKSIGEKLWDLLKNLGRSWKLRRRKIKEPKEIEIRPESEPEIKPQIEPKVFGEKTTPRERILPKEKFERIQPQEEGYRFPELGLLEDPPQIKPSVSAEELSHTAKALKETLATFEVGIEGDSIEKFPGPVITRYELKPAPGIKVNQIVGLADDLALALQARRIRIVAPVPGKAKVGVEIPNKSPQTVYLKDILTAPAFQNTSHRLAMALGKTTSGEPFVADLARMPHLLIAGATGSGKSMCINAIITSLLFRLHPDEVRFIMIDPKMLELTVYDGIPHLEKSVVTSPKIAEKTLAETVIEMEERYKKLARAGVRSIEDFNKKRSQVLPYLVIVVDELADLMMSSSTRTEALVTRLAQMARAVGIHLILATQRPSVDVITGLIKANFSARIAFQVASKIDSRTIMDMNGAEKLLGKGDMLFIQPGQPEPQRIHGAYISQEDTERIVEFLKKQKYVPQPLEIFTQENIEDEEIFSEDKKDDLFSQAVELVIRHKQGSVSLLQRRLGIGYQRAARLIDQLEEAGVVGPYDGSKAREVLVDESYLESKKFLEKKNSS